MAYIRKQFGKWQVNIRKKGYPGVYKAFHDVKDARKFARDVESGWREACLKVTVELEAWTRN